MLTDLRNRATWEGRAGCDTENRIAPVVCQERLIFGVAIGADVSSFLVAEKFRSDLRIHLIDERNGADHGSEHIPMVLVKRHDAVPRSELGDATCSDGQTQTSRDRAVPREHEMRFVADEFEIVEAHFFDSGVDVFRDALEMIPALNVIEWVDEARIRGIERVDVLQDLVSSQMIGGE